MSPLGKRFPKAETQIRDRIDDLIVPSEDVVLTTVEEDDEARCWVTLTCPLVGFSQEAAFDRQDLIEAGGFWPLWCEGVISELDRRLREQGKSSW